MRGCLRTFISDAIGGHEVREIWPPTCFKASSVLYRVLNAVRQVFNGVPEGNTYLYPTHRMLSGVVDYVLMHALAVPPDTRLEVAYILDHYERARNIVCCLFVESISSELFLFS